MRSKTILGLAVLCAAACHKGKVEAGGTDDAAAADAEVAAAEADASAEIAPPAPAVAGDPSVPLNEAVVGTAPTASAVTADVAPPAPVEEDQPASPEADDVWIPGYWWWSPVYGRYVWVGGAWRHPPHDQLWTPGGWGLIDGRYHWTPGYWGPRGYVREMIGFGPPPIRTEVYGPAPGVGFMWTPGYYAFRGGAYEWVGGSWLRPPQPGFGWVEPRYVSVGGRFFLQPGRWDVPPAQRGVVYRPDINVRPGARLTPTPVPQGIVAAHASFVTNSSHAIAQGATRTPSGGYVVPHGTAAFHGGGPGGGPAGGPGGQPEHAGQNPQGEPHPGGNPPANEPHPGAGNPGATEPHAQVGGSRPEEEHRAEPVHGGGPPPGGAPPAGGPPHGEPANAVHVNPTVHPIPQQHVVQAQPAPHPGPAPTNSNKKH
jgi:hypothetical protein